jgi:type IV pilus assembly protein PilP
VVIRGFFIVALVIMLMGSGCEFLGGLLGTSEKPKVAPPTRAKTPPTRPAAAPPAPAEKAPAAAEAISPDEVIKAEEFHYVSAEKRDPFRPFIILAKAAGEPPLPPLQRYDLAQLRLVGIVLGGERSRAMVEDASGKGYVVSRGTRIGRRNGVVVRIEKDRLIVEEQYKDSAGNLKSKEASMILHKMEGESP